MKKVFVILSTVVLLTQGTATAARPGRDRIDRGMIGYGNGYDCSRIMGNAKLKLTAEQTTRLRVLDEKYRQESESIREQLSDKGRELKAEWLRSEPDRGRVELLRCDVVKLQARLRETLSAQRTDMLKVLTPEQQAQVQDGGPGRFSAKSAGFDRK
jgi:Spy/CpxP family protein refolding chaperone